MKTIFVLIGVTGVGKSTYAKELQSKFGGTVLSSDEIRKEYVKLGRIPKEYDSKYNRMVFDTFYERMEECAKKSENIYVDSTNVELKYRKRIFDIAKRYGYLVKGEIMLLTDDECVKRINYRQSTDPNSHYIADPLKAVQIYKERLNKDYPKMEEGFHIINTYENGKLIKKEQSVLIASTNAGKISIYAQIFKELGINYCSLRDLSVGINPEENGSTEEENAKIKAEAYHNATGLPVISNDSGLIVDKFSAEDQPGVFVRRFNGKDLTDDEMIEIFSKKLQDVGGESDAHFNVALCICDGSGNYFSKVFISPRYMVATPSKVVCKGLPLRSLDYSKKFNKYMSEMTIEEANGSEGECILEQKEFIKNIFC